MYMADPLMSSPGMQHKCTSTWMAVSCTSVHRLILLQSQCCSSLIVSYLLRWCLDVLEHTEDTADLAQQDDHWHCLTTSPSTVRHGGYYHVWQLYSIIQLLTLDATKTLIHVFASSRLDYCNSLLYYMIYITDQHLKHCSWCRTLLLGWWLLSANGPYHPSLAFSLLTPSLPTYCLQAGNATGCLNQNELENLADFTYSAILCCHTILTNLHFQDEHNIQCRLTTLQTMRNSLMVRDTTPWHSAC